MKHDWFQAGKSRFALVAIMALLLMPLTAASADDGEKAALADRVTASAVAHTDIVSAGPLKTIAIGIDGAVQIAHSADTVFEYYPPSVAPGDAGTFLAVGNTLFAPNFANHGGTATGNLGAYTVFTSVSQTPVSGAGTLASPFQVTTVYDATAAGLRITQIDTYVVGEEAYRTDLTVSNLGNSAQSAILYRAGDCFLGGSDVGFGVVNAAAGAVACAKNANNTPAGRIEQLLPITGGNNYSENTYSTVWSQIGTKTALPNTCLCASAVDNGIGISWTVSIPAGSQVTRSHLTTFSPIGSLPLTTVKTADSATSSASAQNGYTITISNPNAVNVSLTSIVDTLPSGFTYVNNSTTGVTTANPGVSGQTLTWAGPFNVTAGGTVQLHFNVNVAAQSGDYFNNATAVAAGGFSVGPTGPTAQITVSGGVMGGRGFTVTTRSNPPRVELTWQGGSAQTGYTLLKLPLGGQLTQISVAGNATSYSDTAVGTNGFTCYALIPLVGQAQQGMSDALCGWPGFGTIANPSAPSGSNADPAARMREAFSSPQ